MSFNPRARQYRDLLRRDPNREVDEEIAFHLAMREAEYRRAGLTPTEAERETMTRFGDVDAVRDECQTMTARRTKRDARARWWQDLGHDVRYALRVIRSNPGFATIVTSTIALGIGANTATFSVAYGVLARPLPYADADRIARVWLQNPSRGIDFFAVTGEHLAAWRARSRVFTAIGAFDRERDVTVTRGGEPLLVKAANVSPDVFDLLETRPALGRRLSLADIEPGAPPVVVLGHELWSTRFGGDRNIVGARVSIDGTQHLVLGVMRERFIIPGSVAQMWTPLSRAAESPGNGTVYVRALGRLRPGATVESARRELDAVSVEGNSPWIGDQWHPRVVSVPRVVVGREWNRAVLVLTGVVGVVLLIACANAANLQLARGAGRRREIAVRVTLGAGRGRIVRQLIVESLVLSGIGGIVGLALAYAGVNTLRAMGAATIPRIAEIAIDWRALAFTAVLSIGTGLLFGLIPSLGASRLDLNAIMKDGGRGNLRGGANQRLRSALVIGQLALSLVLLVGAGLIVRSFVALSRIDLGFEPRGLYIANVRLPEARYSRRDDVFSFQNGVLDELRATPGIQSASLINSAPFAGLNFVTPFRVPDQPWTRGEPDPEAMFRDVYPEYFHTAGVELVRGRDFAPSDRRDAAPVVIINEAAAQRYWPNDDPLGRQIQVESGGEVVRHTIVGIARDVRYYAVKVAEREPTLYFSALARGPWTSFAFVVRSSDPRSAAIVGQAVRRADRLLPAPTVSAATALVEQETAAQRFAVHLLGMFATVALVVAALGTYGVLTYLIRQRSHELGVRLALGASPAMLARSVVLDATRLAGIGIALGLFIAWTTTRLLGALLFRVSPTDAATFVATSGLLVATAVIASIVPAARAARVDPVSALRAE